MQGGYNSTSFRAVVKTYVMTRITQYISQGFRIIPAFLDNEDT